MGLVAAKQSGLPTATRHTHQHPEWSPSAFALPRLRDSVSIPPSSCLRLPFRSCFLLAPIETLNIFRPGSSAHVPMKRLQPSAEPRHRLMSGPSIYAFCSCHLSIHV